MLRALSIREAALGAEHADVALTQQHLADLLIEMGDLALAGHLLTRAREILESVYGQPHPEMGRNLMLLGDGLCAQATYRRQRRSCTAV